MRLLTLLRDPFVRRGARDMMVFGPAMAAWAIVTGVAMSQSGLGTSLSLLMSLIVFAGTAQLASLPLIAAGAPTWVVWASALCLNLRFVNASGRGRPRPPACVLAVVQAIAHEHWPIDTAVSQR